MKTWGALLLLCGAIQFTAPVDARAQAEEIIHFRSRIEIQTNGSIIVTETIRVRSAGVQIRHGIFRDFPQLYHGAALGLRVKTGFEVLSLKRDEQSEPYHTENRANGTRVYAGSADEFVPAGVHTYELVYSTDNQLGFFRDHDELYWNATGNGWVFPIQSATATVALPGGAEPTKLDAYTGPQGARGRDFLTNVVNGEAYFETTRPLGPGEGLTIVVGWPKGLVPKPSAWVKWRAVIRANTEVVLAFVGLALVLIYYSIVWVLVGRDPKRGTIIPLYGPPKFFSPASVRYLSRMGFDNRAFTAAILNLAVQGKLSIKEYDPKVYTLFRQDTREEGLQMEERILLRNLFTDGDRLALINTNHEIIAQAKKDLKERLVQFQQDRLVTNLGYWVPGLLLSLLSMGALALVVVTPRVTVGEYFWVAGLLLSGIFMNAIFYRLLKAPTRSGRQILDQIEGFKLYLGVAEKDRLNLENPPERTPQLFELFLPYALALGVENLWSEQFADVLARAGEGGMRYSPAWYSGNSWDYPWSSSFASSMGDSLSSAISSASTAPGSDSGFSSGGGGGGSSGGGGGGGGGGGW